MVTQDLLKTVKIIEKQSSKIKEELNKKEVMESLGFTSAKVDSSGMSPRIAERLQYFSTKYPYYKFIDKKSLKDVCKKWGLVWGDADMYKGLIPDKNLKQIQDFKINEEYVFERNWSGKWIPNFSKSKDDFTKRQQRRIEKCTNEYKYKYKFGDFETLKIGGLEIIAPKDMFKKGEVKGIKITPKIKDDPIVIVEVAKKVYAIITAWGPEATDLSIFNTIQN